MLNDRLLQFVNIDLQEVKVLFFSFSFFCSKEKNYCNIFCLPCVISALLLIGFSFLWLVMRMFGRV